MTTRFIVEFNDEQEAEFIEAFPDADKWSGPVTGSTYIDLADPDDETAFRGWCELRDINAEAS